MIVGVAFLEMRAVVEVNIRKRLGAFRLDVSFEADQPCLGILGASGSGKSVTLKCIAGIVTPDEGRIVIDGRVLFDSAKKINVKPQERKVGYLFQDYALFPTFTAYDNIASGIGHTPARKKKEIVDGLIRRFHLEGLEKLYPHQLSGGQQQRVALARIVACEPAAILLDEPFSALDSHLRLQMQLEISEILKGCRYSVMVTHNLEEAYRLCQNLLVIDGGRVTASGKREQLFNDPQTMKTAMLVGCKNISRIERAGDYEAKALDWGGLVLRTHKPLHGGILYVGLHANRFVPVYEKDENATNLIRINVADQIATQADRQIYFKNADGGDPGAQAGLWWDCGREGMAPLPEYLRIPPEDILLLTGD